MKNWKQPFHLLLITSLCMLVFAIFSKDDQSLDLHSHDSYLIISSSIIYGIASLYLFLLWILYLKFQKIFYAKQLATAQIWSTVISIFAISTLCYYHNNFSIDKDISKTYFDLNIIKNYTNNFKLFSTEIQIILGIFHLNSIDGSCKFKYWFYKEL